MHLACRTARVPNCNRGPQRTARRIAVATSRCQREQSAVISRTGAKTPPSQTGAACVPSGRFFTAPTGLMTAHCSRVTVPLLLQPQHFLLEHPAALRVVAEHVEARARRREHDRAARAPPTRTPSAPPPTCPPRRAPATRAAERLARSADAPRRSRRPSACRDASGSRRSPKSPPLNRPPMIATSPPSKLSIARRAASMLVAFESLTNRTPPTSPTGSSACSRPVNPSTARVIAAGVDAGERRHRRRRERRRRPGGGRAAGSTTAARAARAPAVRAPHDRVAVDDDAVAQSPRHREQQLARSARRPPSRSVGRVVGVEDRPVVRGLVARRCAPSPPRTPRRSRGDRDDRARSSAAPQSTAGTSRSPRAGSCSPRRRESCPRSSRRPARSARGRCCRRPARGGRPPRSIRPVSVVVVDLPFVPVIATIRPRSQRDASSSSPMTGTPARRAASMRRLPRRHARAEHDQVGAA